MSSSLVQLLGNVWQALTCVYTLKTEQSLEQMQWVWFIILKPWAFDHSNIYEF